MVTKAQLEYGKSLILRLNRSPQEKLTLFSRLCAMNVDQGIEFISSIKSESETGDRAWEWEGGMMFGN